MALPKTRQLIADISHQISDGLLQPGERLPSTAELRRQYAVSVTVVRNAMLWLEAVGLVDGVPAVGVFVASRAGEKTGGSARRSWQRRGRSFVTRPTRRGIDPDRQWAHSGPSASS